MFLELIRRGYKVNVGKVGDMEIDFAAEKDSQLNYIQVTASMTDKNTFEREMASLTAVADNYPKTVLTLDRYTPGDYNGIKVTHLIDWLLDIGHWSLSYWLMVSSWWLRSEGGESRLFLLRPV